jgi:hypothetical protein
MILGAVFSGVTIIARSTGAGISENRREIFPVE